MMDKLLTVFTPTYNREKELHRLYDSLLAQTDSRFEWLIVDDGSADDTASVVREWISEGKIPIRYIFQKNQGKAAAHNRGVEETRTLLFTCVDSDDYLLEDAVETVLETDLSAPGCIGALYKKGTSVTETVTKWEKEIEYSTLYDAYHGGGLQGDTMLVFKTDVIKKHRFPSFPGEKFVPEAYLYDQLDQEGKLRFVNKVIYICEYLEGGYTSNIRKMNAENPKGYLAFISQRIQLDKDRKELVQDLIRYTAIRFVMKEGSVLHPSHRTLSVLCLIPGYMFYFRDYKRYQRGTVEKK